MAQYSRCGLWQVIKEKLAFPSGTATAQLISVLHRTPLQHATAFSSYATSTRRRRSDGYEHINAENMAENAEPVPLNDDNDSDERRRKLVAVGWTVLGWSFSASAALTVCTLCKRCLSNTRGSRCHFEQLFSYFFPFIYAIPIFGVHMARDWLWVFSPSLSYVGQGHMRSLPSNSTVCLNTHVQGSSWGFPQQLA